MLVFSIATLFILLPNLSALPAKSKPKQDPLLQTYRSPLDQDGEYYDTDEKLDISSLPSLNRLPTDFLFSDFGKVPVCQQQCTQKFSKIMNSALKAPDHYHRFEQVCENFNDTLTCMTDSADLCVNQEPFDVLTSGLYYMCVEQRKAFEVVIECIDAQAFQVQQECEEQCHTKGKLANWAVQSGLLDAFMHGAAVRGGGGGPGMVVPRSGTGGSGMQVLGQANPQFMRNVVQEGCELARCTLGCLRAKFDARCQGSAGALLSEAFVRPIAEAQKLMGFGQMSGILHAFMPKQCDFMLNSEGLGEFRIDPKLDQTLKNKYESDGTQKESNDAGFDESIMNANKDVENVMNQLNNLGSDNSDYPDVGPPAGAQDMPSEPIVNVENPGLPADNAASMGNQPEHSVKQAEDDYMFAAPNNPLDSDDYLFARN